MADPLEPANPDPFAKFDVTATKPSYAAEAAAAAPGKPTGPNENQDPFQGFNLKATSLSYPAEDGSSTFGAFRRGLVRSAIPAIGSLPAMGAGAELGAAAGLPLAPFTAGLSVPVGGVLGALTAGYLGTTALHVAQDWALKKLPDKWQEAIGMDDRQAALDEKEHSTASFLGGLLPFAVAMRPGAFTAKTAGLPENATALQRIMSNPVTARVFGGAVMGGMELGNEAVAGQNPDWTKVAIATGFGLVFNKPTRIGETLIEAGAHPTRSLLGRPHPTIETAPGQPAPAAEAAPAPGTSPIEKTLAGAPEAQPAGEPVTGKDFRNEVLERDRKGRPYQEPTVAEAADLNVAGPGITEATFNGGEQRSIPSAQMAHETARIEKSVIGEPRQEDIHEVARRHEPEVFTHYDELTARRDDFRRWINEYNTPGEDTFREIESRRAALQAELEAHVGERKGYTGGPEARRLRAQLRGVERERTDLTERAAKYRTGQAEETADLAAARKHLLDTEFELRDLAPQVRAAYGRAADALGSGVVEPRPAPEAPAPAAAEAAAPPLAPDATPPPAAPGSAPVATPGPAARPIAEQKAFIAQDVARQLVAAGRPQDEANAAGTLLAARYETRAARFQGELGTAEELYRRDSAEIRGPGGRRAPPAPASPAAPAAPAARASERLAAEFKPGPGPKAPEAPIPESEIVTKAVGEGRTTRKHLSLLEFITARGGIRPEEANIGDLRTIFGTKNKFVPGFGQLIRPKGMFLDQMREAAAEAGYLNKDMEKSTVRDLLDAVDAENRGRKQYVQGEEAEATAKEQDPAQRLHEMDTALDRELEAVEIEPSSVAGKLRDRVIEIMDKEGVSDPLIAYERAVMEQDENVARAGEVEPRSEYLPGWDVPDEPRAAPGAGEATPQAPDQGGARAGEAPRAAGEGDRALELSQEPGADGKPQQLIPGVEPVSDAQRAQLGADQPLRGGDEAPGGLFDTEARNQRELFQRDPAAPFYSAVDRAVENTKLEKGTPEQWLGTIRNTAGVKAEEMEWLGLPDWLKEQEGQVTKAQVQDYIRANQIQVQEVEKGGTSVPGLNDAAISNEVALLKKNGFEPTQNPNDDSVMAFQTEEHGPWEGDIITADEIKAESATLGAAAEKIEQYFYKGIGEQSRTKFSGHTLPGGENYRELLLMLPPTEGAPTIKATPLEGGGFAFTANGQGFGAIGRLDGMTLEQAEGLAREQFPRSAVARQMGYGPAGWGDTGGGTAKPNEFRSTHWEEPNVLAHIRMNDRTIDGKKTLFVEEIQSDWHQKGRKGGYSDPVAAKRTKDKLDAAGYPISNEDAQMAVRDGVITQEDAIALRRAAVPDAPFKTTWPELSMKRVLRYAAEHGYEQVGWTPGDVQAARYDLSQHLEEIRVERTKNDAGMMHYTVNATRKGGGQFAIGIKPEAELADAVGKDMAERIIKNPEDHQIHSGLDLKVGGEGMQGFYDKILPNAANKLVKKFDSKVGEATLHSGEIAESDARNLQPDGRDERQAYSVLEGHDFNFASALEDAEHRIQNARDQGDGPEHARYAVDIMRILQNWEKMLSGDETTQVHTVPITEKLRDAATEQGFPLFQGARGKINILEGRKPIITLMKDANASTFFHETGHQWLEELLRDAQHPRAPDVIKNDADTVLQWLGAHSTEDVKTRHHEKFARGFEQYLRDGVAPSKELAGVFGQFKEWLVRLYETIKGLGKPISDDIRDVFDRMLSMEPNRTVIANERERGPTLADIHEADARLTEPHEAEAVADRIAAERERYVTEPPPEIANEIEAVVTKVEAERAAAAGTQPGAEPGEGGAGRGEVGAGGGEPGADTAGGGVGEKGAAVGAGGDAAAGESKRVSESERGRGAGEESGHQLAPGPARLFEPTESRLVDKAGNIRVENLTTSEDVAQAIREAAEQNNDFIGDRRGVITDGQVMDLASDLGMTAESLNMRKIGQAFNAEQIMAARKLLVESATQVSAAMKQAARGSDEDVMAYALAKDRHQMIQAQVAGITAEAGRALRAFRSIAGQEETQAVDQFIKSATGKTLFQLRQEAQLGATLESPQQVSKFMQDAQKRTFGRMLVEYWINGLLSGPATHATNTIGNLILTVQHAIPETAAAALIGRVRRAMGREGEYVRFGEVGAGLRGIQASLPSAIKGAGQSFKSGVSMLLPGEEARAMPFQPFTELAEHARLDESATYASVMGDAYGALRGMQDGIIAAGAMLKAGGVEGAPTVATQYSHLGAIPDITYKGVNVLPLGTAARMPGRFLSAADSFFGAVNFSMAKNARAYRIASEEGLTGTAFDARVAQIRDNPSEALMSEFVAQAAELRLMEKGGKFLNALSHLSNVEIGGFPALKFVTPFVHVAGNILQQSVMHRTPIGLLSAEIRADLIGKNGNVAQDMAMARMAAGTILAVTMGGLAAQGYASGSGPTDQNEAAMWRLAGNQAHSVRIGDMWYGVQKLGPTGMLMSIAADLYSVANSASKGEMEEAAAHLVHAFSQNILDQSMMKGPAELLRAINDSDRYGEQYVRNFLSAFVPYSIGMAQMAKVSDPYSRQTRTIVDAIRAKVPGHMDSWFGAELFPKRNVWGEPMLAPETVGGPGVTGMYQKQMSDDPVNRAMIDLGIGPAPVQRKIRGVELEDQQYDDFARLAGRMTKTRLDAMVRSADWQQWPPNIRASIVQEVIKQSRETARGMMMLKYPQIVRDAVQQRRDAFTEPPESIR